MATPTPERCTCERIPVAAKAKGGYWTVACSHCQTSARGSTVNEAVRNWNTAIQALKYKEANK